MKAKQSKTLTARQMARAIAEWRVSTTTESLGDILAEAHTEEVPFSLDDVARQLMREGNCDDEVSDWHIDAAYLLGIEVGKVLTGNGGR